VKTWALVAILACAAPAAASAQEPAFSPGLDRCLNAPSGMSTAGQIGCVDTELKLQDARLNQAYRGAMGRLNSRQQGKLRTAQRAWIAFRDADCAARQDEDWGTLSRVEAAFCVLEKTARRAEELETFAVRP